MTLDSRLSECECRRMSLNPLYIGNERRQTFVRSVGLLTHGGESWLLGNTEVTSALRFIHPTLTCDMCVEYTVDAFSVQGPRGNITYFIHRGCLFEQVKSPREKTCHCRPVTRYQYSMDTFVLAEPTRTACTGFRLI